MKKKFLLVFFIYIMVNNSVFSKEEIIFSIKKKSYTTIDIENKINNLLFINRLKINDNNINMLSEKAEQLLIEEELLNEYLKEKNIKISENDINETYKNIIDYITSENNENFLEVIENYRLDINYIKKQISNDITKQIVREIIIKDIEIELKIDENINYDDYIEYKINNISLYKNTINDIDYNNQKKNILKILEKNDFETSLKVINNNKYNISSYQNKWITLDKINIDLKKLIINSQLNRPFIYEDSNAFYIFEKTEKKNPDINMKYTFIQISEDSKDKLNKYLKIENLCSADIIKKLKNTNETKIEYYENINKKDLNNQIFNKINYGNHIIISNENINTLIYICNKSFSHEELKEYIINRKFSDDLDQKYQELIIKLKSKYNYISY